MAEEKKYQVTIATKEGSRVLPRLFNRGTYDDPIKPEDYKKKNDREYVDIEFNKTKGGAEKPILRAYFGYGRREALEEVNRVISGRRKARPISLDRKNGIIYDDNYLNGPIAKEEADKRLKKGYKPKISVMPNGLPGLIEWVTGEKTNSGRNKKDILTDIDYALSVHSKEGQHKYLNRINDYVGRIEERGSTESLEKGLSRLEQSVETIKGWIDNGDKKNDKIIIRGRNGRAFAAFNERDLKEVYDDTIKKTNRLWNELDKRKNNKKLNRQVIAEIIEAKKENNSDKNNNYLDGENAEARNKAECQKENYDRGKRTTERNISHEETDRLMEEANRVIEEAKRKEASEKKEELSTIARYVGVLAERGVRETEQKTPKSDEEITPPYEEKNDPISEEIILDTRPTAGPRKKFQDAERRKPSKGLWGRICEGIRTTLTGVTDYDREIEGDKERARKEWFDSGMDKRFNEQIRDEMKAKTRIR